MIFLILCKSCRRFCNRHGLGNSRFQYGAERGSKGNGTNEDFPVIYINYEPKLKDLEIVQAQF